MNPFQVERALFRLGDIKRSMANVRQLLEGKTFKEVETETVTQAALERFLEIVSEASRHVPAEWKAQLGAKVPWRQVADLGNSLRHAYRHVDLQVLWDIYRNDLDPLERAIDAMIEAYGPIP